jgi:hypothetical protein
MTTPSTTTTTQTVVGTGTAGATVKVCEGVYIPINLYKSLPDWLKNRHGSIKSKYHTLVEFVLPDILDPKKTINWEKWVNIAKEPAYAEHLKELVKKAEAAIPSRPLLTVVNGGKTDTPKDVPKLGKLKDCSGMLLEAMKTLHDNDVLMEQVDELLYYDKQTTKRSLVDLLDDDYYTLVHSLSTMQPYELADTFLGLVGLVFEKTFNYEATGMYDANIDKMDIKTVNTK